MDDLRIIFMGTPEFAAYNLKVLHQSGAQIVAVVTAPDRPSGRGQKLQPSAVKLMAEELSIPVLQPEKLRDPEFQNALRSFRPDLQVVVAFRMLPESVWNLPPKGTFNLHASLLPQYRGAAPIHWAVINGEIETGVTTFFLDHKIDTGKIILQKKVAIKEADNVGVIHDKLMELGGELVVETVDALLNNNIQPIPQEKLIEGELKNAPKLFRENCKIDWTQSVETIYNFIRGLSPYPSAWSPMFVASENKAIDVKVFASEKIIQKHNLDTGTIQTDGKEYIQVAVRDGFIVIKELQLPGKKRLKVDELLRGYEITNDFYMLTNKKK